LLPPAPVAIDLHAVPVEGTQSLCPGAVAAYGTLVAAFEGAGKVEADDAGSAQPDGPADVDLAPQSPFPSGMIGTDAAESCQVASRAKRMSVTWARDVEVNPEPAARIRDVQPRTPLRAGTRSRGSLGKPKPVLISERDSFAATEVMSGRLSRTRAYSLSPKSRETCTEEVETVIDKSSPRQSANLQKQLSLTDVEDRRESSQSLEAEEPKLLALLSDARRRSVCAPPGPILVRSDRVESLDRPVQLENLDDTRSPRRTASTPVASVPYTLEEADRRRSVIQAPTEISPALESLSSCEADTGDENLSTFSQFGSSGRRATSARQSTAASSRSWAHRESENSYASAAPKSPKAQALQNTAVRVALAELNRGHDREPWSPPSLSPTTRSRLSDQSLRTSRASFQRTSRASGISFGVVAEHLESEPVASHVILLADVPAQQCRTTNAPCTVLEAAPLHKREQLFQAPGTRGEIPDGRDELETERSRSRQVDPPVLAALCELGVLSVVPSPASLSLISSAESTCGGPDQKKRSDGGSKSSVDVHDIAPDASEAIYALSGLPPKRASLCKVSKSAASSTVATASLRVHDFNRAFDEGTLTQQADAHPQWADRKRRRYGPVPVFAQRG